MIADSALTLPCATRPRSFAGLMTLYESNFIRLGWLVPDLAAVRGTDVSTAPGDLALHLSIEERTRYTTTLHLTYYFREADGQVADPDLYVRVYHDARLAEAMACASQRRLEALRGFATHGGSELRCRWNRNIMLNKWLEYCADKGHRFRGQVERDGESAEVIPGQQ